MASGFGGFRRDQSILDQANSARIPQIQHTLPSATSPDQIAPWMTEQSTPRFPSGAFGTTFYNESSDNLSLSSQLSPGCKPGTIPGFSNDSETIGYFGQNIGDERRPSVISVATASSGASKSGSLARSGKHTYKKLQGFFGEDNLGEESETSERKEGRSHSYSRASQRHPSNASTAIRGESPQSSRPLTPVPSSDVVPFLYQDSQVSQSGGFYC